MKKNRMIKGTSLLTLILTFAFVGCSSTSASATPTATNEATSSANPTTVESTTVNTSENAIIDTTDLFSTRDLEQTADTTDAQTITVENNKDISITEEGVYVLSGTASEVTITVEAADDAKVQIVLDNLNIINTDSPVIYIKSGDKVFVTTTNSENNLTVTGTFVADGTTNTDAVIFSKSDLTLNGLGTVTITSTKNGVSSKDDLKVTGGTWNITSTEDSLEANDSIAIADGTFTINSGKDALHSENDEDNTKGYIYIAGGTFTIDAADDGIQATTILEIDGGTFDISAVEGLEGTDIEINGGTVIVNGQQITEMPASMMGGGGKGGFNGNTNTQPGGKLS